MTWTTADPGLPPLPGGLRPTPPDKPTPYGRANSVRWITAKFPGALERGRTARRHWAAVSAETVIDARRELAMQVRHFTADPASPRGAREPLADRALGLELAATAAEARDLITEIEAIGLHLEVKP